MKRLVVLLSCFLLSQIFCVAQPGFPDNSFGTGGITHTNIVNATQLPLRPQAMANLAENKIVVAGLADGIHCNITQFLANGKVDSSFGDYGIVYIQNFEAYDIAVQNDGKLVIGGNSSVGNGVEHMVMVRLNTDGRYDKGFAGTGRIDFSLTNQDNALLALAIQPDGKIVGAGYATSSNNYDFAAVRLNTTGSFDESFDGDGKVMTPVDINNDYASAVAIQSNGKIVLGGGAVVGGYWNFGIIRYTETGGLDNEFNGTGKQIIAMSATNDEINEITIQQDQKIVLGGYAHNGSNIDFALARLTTTGTPDNDFDGDGKLVVPVGSSDDNLTDLKIQSDGKIVAFGYSFNSTYDYVILRYTAGGAPDTDFDTDGKVIGSYSNYHDVCLAGFIQPDDKIVAGGYSFLNTISDISVFRFTPNGTPDNGFDEDGKATVHQGKSTDYATGMAIQADGKLIVVGNTYTQTFTDAALVRYKTDGHLDPSFGTGGKVITTIGSNQETINAVAVQPDGKIVVAGWVASGGYSKMFVARYLENGTLDNDFDGDGKLILNLGVSNDVAYTLLIQPDNKILVGGYTRPGSNTDFALVRLMPGGTPDNSFDNDGIVTTQFGTENEFINSLALNIDGTIVAVGTASINSTQDFAIARYTSTGALDNSFDTDGKLIINITPGNHDRAEYVTIQPDGKMVVVGSSYVLSTFDFAIIRINTNGSLDESFSEDGKLTIDVGVAFGTYDGLTGVAIQHDGKIVVSGVSSVQEGYRQFYTVARLTSGGVLDNSFGTDGITKITDITSVTNSSEAISRNIVLTNDRIYVAGTTNVVTDDFAIMALQVNNSAVSAVVYRFIGDGNFSTPANWEGGVVPPDPLPANAEVIIAPAAPDAQCILDIPFHVSPGGKFSVLAGKKFIVPNLLNLQ